MKPDTGALRVNSQRLDCEGSEIPGTLEQLGKRGHRLDGSERPDTLRSASGVCAIALLVRYK